MMIFTEAEARRRRNALYIEAYAKAWAEASPAERELADLTMCMDSTIPRKRLADMLGVVVRLRRVFEALRDAPWSTWSERAQAAGFFDHPQMARDFRRLLGTAPPRWAARGPGLATSLADSAA